MSDKEKSIELMQQLNKVQQQFNLLKWELTKAKKMSENIEIFDVFTILRNSESDLQDFRDRLDRSGSIVEEYINAHI